MEAYEILLKHGMSEEQIEELISEKKKTYGQYMSLDSMIYLIAEEHGIIKKKYEMILENGWEIDYSEFVIDIEQIVDGMSQIVVQGRVSSNVTVKEFMKKDGTLGIIGYFFLKDITGNIKVVVWGDKAKQLDKHSLKFNDIIRIINGYSKKGREEELEIHLGKRGFLDFSPEDIIEKNFPLLEKLGQHKNQVNIKLEEIPIIKSEFVKCVEGIISNLEFKEILKKNGLIEFLLSFNLSDDTDTIRVVAFGMSAVSAYKALKKANRVSLSNIKRKMNDFTNQFELYFTSITTCERI